VRRAFDSVGSGSSHGFAAGPGRIEMDDAIVEDFT
jgi:hypothetical protein